jgi:hypothetical protein
MAVVGMQIDVLWKAAILTCLVFIVGLGIGIWLDDQRVTQVRSQLTDIDLQWNDARLASLYFQQRAMVDSTFCRNAIDANLAFNDRIYQQGLEIERFEQVNRFTPELLQEKKRYAMLQLQFWFNSLALKQECNATYSTLVYFYDHYDQNVSAQQKAQAEVLTEMKNRCGANLYLIPLPLDLDISSISMIAAQYNINSAPSLLVDEKYVFHGLTGTPMLQQLFPCSS